MAAATETAVGAKQGGRGTPAPLEAGVHSEAAWTGRLATGVVRYG
ncbi:hypothetical protein [Skermanella stibiiresistens]|nr:hypothetical protein [Skermanella stibiiresistens]